MTTETELTRDFDLIMHDLSVLVTQAHEAVSSMAQSEDKDAIYLYAMLGVLSEAQEHAGRIALAREAFDVASAARPPEGTR